MKYIFWPKHLKAKEDLFSNECLVAISISLNETHPVVMDIIPKRLQDEVQVKDPYTVIAEKHKESTHWNFEFDTYCVVEFDAPNLTMLEFFSLEPISLTLPEKKFAVGICESLNDNMIKICEHPRYSNHDKTLKQTLGLINLYQPKLRSFQEKYPEYTKQQVHQHICIRTLITELIKSTSTFHIICRILFYLTMSLCAIAKPLSKFLNWKILKLVNISQTIQQIDLRCQQLCYFPVQYFRINNNIAIQEPLPGLKTGLKTFLELRKDLPSEHYPEYIRFYNTIWLILNDISFGMILGSLLIQYNDTIAIFLHNAIELCMYNLLKHVTNTLSQSPFGIKLNEELTRFLGDLFLWIIEFSYSEFIYKIADVQKLKLFISCLSIISCGFGASFALSIMVDFFSFLSIHIHLFYLISRKLYHWQLHNMSSFYYLFRGKKKNVLRDRIDHNNFELDQLLMGTLLFIILAFLTPTVLAFYISYVLFHLAIIALEIAFEALISLLNHFPLFVLLLRIKDQNRIPGGVSLCIKDSSDIVRFELKNKPLSIALMFQPYSLLMNQLIENYFSFKIINKIIHGLPISVNRTKLYHVLYSSLPSEPIDLDELYYTLNNVQTPTCNKR